MDNNWDDGKFGDRLTALINDCQTSNKKIAEKLGISDQAVGNMIRTGKVSYENVRKIANIFNVNWVWLRYGPAVLEDVVKDSKDGPRSQRRTQLELKNKLAKLEKDYYHLLLLLERLPIVLWETDINSVFTLSEGHGLAELGLTPGEVVGKEVLDVYQGNKTIADLQAKALAGECNLADVPVGDTNWIAVCCPIIEDQTITGSMGIAILKSCQ